MNIKAIHLLSGIDIYGEVEEAAIGGGYFITNPSRIAIIDAQKLDPTAPAGQLAAIPQPFAVHSANKKLHIAASAVVFVTDVHDYLIDFYQQAHSPIVLPPRAGKIIPAKG